MMRVISDKVKSAPIQWLAVRLTNIESPNLQRKEKCIKIIKKSEDRKNSLLNERLGHVPTIRLKSRKPFERLPKT